MGVPIVMDRLVEPEWLDILPSDDPHAMRSRRDLRRLNACMRNAATMAAALNSLPAGMPAGRLVEIGAGDGEFLLSVARRTSVHTGSPLATREALLVDRQRLLRRATAAQFAELHWSVQAVECDVMDFLAGGVANAGTLVANLFMHHFLEDELRRILRAVSEQFSLCVAVEPRRSRFGWWVTHGLGLLGCNAVTRHDAPVSVRAGFRDQELSALWPRSSHWRLVERPAGLFSHLFVARKIP